MENLDWFENDGELDKEIFHEFNASIEFQPSTNTIESIIQGKIAVLMSRNYVRKSALRDKVHGFSRNVFSNPVEIICERGKVWVV